MRWTILRNSSCHLMVLLWRLGTVLFLYYCHQKERGLTPKLADSSNTKQIKHRISLNKSSTFNGYLQTTQYVVALIVRAKDKTQSHMVEGTVFTGALKSSKWMMIKQSRLPASTLLVTKFAKIRLRLPIKSTNRPHLHCQCNSTITD